jgi:hypothetical protein
LKYESPWPILKVFIVKINEARRVWFSPCNRETLDVSLMLRVVPSAHGYAHGPEISDIGGIALGTTRSVNRI